MSLSYRAFLYRLRRLAEIALKEYSIEYTKLKLIAYTGNGLYQVTVPSGNRIAPGKYTLRLHQPHYMKPKYISSEMEWLSALNEEGIRVPTPIRNLEGKWLIIADGGYEIPQKRTCTLIGWTEGRVIEKNIQPQHFNALGRVIGKMHEQSRRWKPPKGFARPHWDWEGLYGEGFSYGVPAADARSAIPKAHQPAFNEVQNRVREVSEQLGKGKKVYGLIHADLGFGDNVAFYRGEARPFDFDDCGFGYRVFDFGVALGQYMMDTNEASMTMREALLEGYEETASLEDIGIEHLDLFIAARIAQFIFFYQASSLAHPEHTEEAKVEINNHAKFLKRLLNKIR
jgi:Ser/Thr protein kinase RdoA (MazF antagonist)